MSEPPITSPPEIVPAAGNWMNALDDILEDDPDLDLHLLSKAKPKPALDTIAKRASAPPTTSSFNLLTSLPASAFR